MKAELVPENGDPPIPITRDVTVIGRREFCDIRIDHHSLSKRHAVLVRTDGLLIIRDLATTNGTKVKGQRVRWAALLPDDRIALGGYKMRVYLGPDDAPAPSEQPRKAFQGVREVLPTRGKNAARQPIPQDVGFPSLSKPVPAGILAGDDLEIIDDGPDSDDSGWRNLLPANPRAADDDDDDVIIELE